jgi:AhpC/TSA antioxidant enzyme
MDPRTFLPPAPTSVAAVPAVGDRAPELPVELDGRPSVVIFLRHVGCPFAEATLRAAHERAAADPATRWIAVSHGSRDATRSWCEAVAGGRPGALELVVDCARAVYAAWGLGRTSLGHFLGRRSLGEVIRLSRQGIRNRHPSGTRWQSAGTFGVDAAGTVRYVHLPRHAGDLPDLQAAAAATRP